MCSVNVQLGAFQSLANHDPVMLPFPSHSVLYIVIRRWSRNNSGEMSMFAKHVITLTYVACHANYTENRMRATPNVTAHQIATGMRLLNL